MQSQTKVFIIVSCIACSWNFIMRYMYTRMQKHQSPLPHRDTRIVITLRSWEYLWAPLSLFERSLQAIIPGSSYNRMFNTYVGRLRISQQNMTRPGTYWKTYEFYFPAYKDMNKRWTSVATHSPLSQKARRITTTGAFIFDTWRTDRRAHFPLLRPR